MISEFWYPFFPSKFKAATRHLTAEQDGIYRRLIDEYMETREPLPDNDIALARIAGVSKIKWLDAARIVRAYFRHANGMLYHDFCDNQLDIQDKRARFRKNSATNAAKKRWGGSEQNQQDTCGAHASGMRGACDKDKDKDKDKDNRIESPKGESGNADFMEAVELYNLTAARANLPIVQKLSKPRKTHLLARLSDAGGLEGWKAALAMLEQSAFCRGENDRGWKADFDFIVRESSFIKLMEGKYNGKQRTNADRNRDALTEWANEPVDR